MTDDDILKAKRKRPSRRAEHEARLTSRRQGLDHVDAQGRAVRTELAERGWWVLQPPRKPGGSFRRSSVMYWEHTAISATETTVRPVKKKGEGVAGDAWVLEMPNGRFRCSTGEVVDDRQVADAFLLGSADQPL